jgi:hypothetical protein
LNYMGQLIGWVRTVFFAKIPGKIVPLDHFCIGICSVLRNV